MSVTNNVIERNERVDRLPEWLNKLGTFISAIKELGNKDRKGKCKETERAYFVKILLIWQP